MDPVWNPVLQTVAVLIGCSRGLWRSYPAWVFYVVISICQSWAMQIYRSDSNRMAGIWSTFGALLLLGMLDSVLELFRQLSEQYQRFRRDRWTWLVIPALLGVLIGTLLVYGRLGTPSDFYRALFLANTVVGSICAMVLLLGWIASIPVRLPIHLRRHLLLLTLYVGSSTLAYASYLQAANQFLIRSLLLFVPPVVMLTWSLIVRVEKDELAQTESEMPESTLEQIQGILRRLS